MVGSRIAHYKLLRQVGSGGMGTVYEAIDDRTDERVAIKLLRRDLSSNREALTRFINEAKATNLIAHPSLVKIFESGSLPNGDAYLVMEFLDGETLSARIRRYSGPMPEMDIRLIGWQLASALAAAHEQGIIHRDLKPGNIVVVPEKNSPGIERVKLLDFGIAKLDARRHNLEDPQTRDGSIMGTPKYMSPEQCRGAGDVDGASDVYSLGVIFFEMLTARHPFTNSEDDGEGLIIAKQIYEPAPRPRDLVPSIGEQMERLVLDMLKKDRALRPTMSAVCSILEESSDSSDSEHHGDSPVATAAAPGPTLAEGIRRAPGGMTTFGSPPTPSTLGGGTGQVVAVYPRSQTLGATLLKVGGGVLLVILIAFLSFQMGRWQNASQHPPAPGPLLNSSPTGTLPPSTPPTQGPTLPQPEPSPTGKPHAIDRGKPSGKPGDEEQPTKRKRRAS